jgi:hypothetical protein
MLIQVLMILLGHLWGIQIHDMLVSDGREEVAIGRHFRSNEDGHLAKELGELVFAGR